MNCLSLNHLRVAFNDWSWPIMYKSICIDYVYVVFDISSDEATSQLPCKEGWPLWHSWEKMSMLCLIRVQTINLSCICIVFRSWMEPAGSMNRKRRTTQVWQHQMQIRLPWWLQYMGWYRNLGNFLHVLFDNIFPVLFSGHSRLPVPNFCQHKTVITGRLLLFKSRVYVVSKFASALGTIVGNHGTFFRYNFIRTVGNLTDKISFSWICMRQGRPIFFQ